MKEMKSRVCKYFNHYAVVYNLNPKGILFTLFFPSLYDDCNFKNSYVSTKLVREENLA